jgi:SNF2 family DNA or RNA helicase
MSRESSGDLDLGVQSWHPSAVPQVVEHALALRAALFATGWNRAFARQGEVKIIRHDLQTSLPRVIAVPIRREPVRTRSFFFTQPALGADGRQGSLFSPRRPPAPAGPRTCTRVKPPGDVIKLEDRLRYVLQPSLESLLETRSLTFPLRPFPYQWEGVAFLYPRETAILADEMGLGKTMQAITAVRLLLHTGEVRRVLLVCPKPLVSNWQREFQVWAPEVPLLVIEGDQARRRWQWQLPDAPVKLANYELLHRDREILEGGDAPDQKALDFDLVILDESQRIKNRASATSQAAQAIRRRRAWAMTGTPIENSSDDLVGIFEFLVPGYLSSEMAPRRMARAVGDYVLRRTKEQVLTDLPPKLFRDAELELTPQQRQSYQLAEDEGVLRLTELGHSMTIQHVFELVLRLKQICNFDPATGESSKLERLEADLEEVAASGRKALVFSQWVETLRRLRGHFERFGPLEFHGRIPPRQREAVLRQFHEDAGRHVLLISYGAGGVGLNLQLASYVFLFDRWWNPAIEDQAVNRAHRIGSSGPVTVTRFLMVDTIEERIERILQEKRDLFDTIFSSAVAQPPKLGLTQQQIFGLFELKCPTGPLNAAA